MSKVTFTVKFTLEDEEVTNFDEYATAVRPDIEDLKTRRLVTMAADIQSGYDLGSLSGNFLILDVEETP